MLFNIRGDLKNGYNVFTGTLNFLPRVGEEIEANGYVYKVLSVRYIIKEGSYYGTTVHLLLEQVN